jgi:O-antigen ligase
MRLKDLKIATILWTFLFMQVAVTLTFLATRAERFISFNGYLQSVKYSTILLLILSIFVLVFKSKDFWKFEILKYSFAAQILILYFTMLIHTDIKAINSPTILLMLLTVFIVFSNNLNLNTLNLLSISISYLNIIIVLLQILKFIPVAQDNVRIGLNVISDRPTGLLFNAFAMGYASVITFAISAYFLKINKFTKLNLASLVFSITSVFLSATRTPLILVAIIGLMTILQDNQLVKKYWKIVTFAVPGIIVLFPLGTVIFGNIIGNQDMATLNGRTFLWDCVTSRWNQFIPFGVGVQGAFPQGFCSDEEWFSKLRHPENMFLLNFVESGILGAVGLVLLFVVTFLYSGKALKMGSFLPMAITSTFLMSSIFYVPLFHYLPFLENRTADRGIYNFFLFTILWMAIMNAFRPESIKLSPKKR